MISMAGKGMHGVSEDAKRTARVIAAYVSEQRLPEVIFQLNNLRQPGKPNVPANYD